MFLWRTAIGALIVSEKLSTRGMNTALPCKLCNLETESIDHLMFLCHVAQAIWSKAGFWMMQIFELFYDSEAGYDDPNDVRCLRDSGAMKRFSMVIMDYLYRRNSVTTSSQCL